MCPGLEGLIQLIKMNSFFLNNAILFPADLCLGFYDCLLNI